MAAWVDYKQLREKLSFAEILKDYGVETKVKGDRASGFCPLPTHQGERRSPSFSVHLKRGIWQCFGCGAKGNVLDFAVRMEGLDPTNTADFRKIALKLQDRHGITSDPPQRNSNGGVKPGGAPEVPEKMEPQTPEAPAKTVGNNKVVINNPLDFALQGLDAAHPYLASRGLQLATVGCFGLGYCGRGLMAGRIAIPLHDAAGKLIGYAGRIVDDGKIDEANPKYRFPSSRQRDGVTYEFHKSLFLYNECRIPHSVSDLIVVEGFPATWAIWQAGYMNVVAVMGASCSSEQAASIIKLVSPNGRVWVFPDGDDAGERMATSVFLQVAPHRAVRLAKLEAGEQPTDCTSEELSAFFGPPPAGVGNCS